MKESLKFHRAIVLLLPRHVEAHDPPVSCEQQSFIRRNSKKRLLRQI